MREVRSIATVEELLAILMLNGRVNYTAKVVRYSFGIPWVDECFDIRGVYTRKTTMLDRKTFEEAVHKGYIFRNSENEFKITDVGRRVHLETMRKMREAVWAVEEQELIAKRFPEPNNDQD